MPRLFAAIALSPETRSELSRLTCGLPGARWIDQANMHLTIRFIGEVDGNRALDVASFLQTVSIPKFDLTISGIGLFGDKKRPKVIWAGVQPCAELMRLNQKLEIGLQRMGFAPDSRKYHPHVTLAKLKNTTTHDARLFCENHAFFRLPTQSVNGFVLFESHLSSHGSQYDAIAHYALAAA